MDKSDTSREAGKRARRAAILAAAEALIRRSGSTDFSMQELAAEAGLSLATAYNLIGPKSTVLYALLNMRADSASAAPDGLQAEGDPLRTVVASAGVAVRHFTGDPGFYRPLMRFLLGVPDPVHHPAFMARGLEYWRRVMDLLERSRCLPVGTHAHELATFVHLFFTGALGMWIHDEYDETRFLRELERYLMVLLFPSAIASGYAAAVRAA